jgi:hypothetical protein
MSAMNVGTIGASDLVAKRSVLPSDREKATQKFISMAM